MNESIILESMLEKEDMLKYNIVKLIYNSPVGEFSSSKIAEKLNLSINTVYNFLEMINSDFHLFFGENLLLIEKGKKLKKKLVIFPQ